MAKKKVRAKKQVRKAIKRGAKAGTPKERKVAKREIRKQVKAAKEAGVKRKALKRISTRLVDKKGITLRPGAKKLLGIKRNKIKNPKDDKDLETFLDKELDIDFVDAFEDDKSTWNPDRIADDVAKQWADRFKDAKNFTPKRLKVEANTTDRLKRYTNKDGGFDAQRYVGDVRNQMAVRARDRGLKGDAMKALTSRSAQLPGSSEPKYGGAVEALKNKLGKINYSDKIEETTSKLTANVTSNADKFKETGMNILKPRSSEDGALPAVGIKDRSARRQRRRQRRQERRAAKTTT
jgi:hypothetical protein